MENIIKQRFLEQILTEEGHKFLSGQTAAINKRLKFRSGTLLNERSFSVQSSADLSGKLSFRFPYYTRYLDMRRKVLTHDNLYMKEKKGYKIYNRFAMGTYYTIARRLSTELTDDVRQAIKESLIEK